MTKQYIITEAKIAKLIFTSAGGDAVGIAETIDSLPELTGKPAAWIWKFQDGSEEVVFVAPHRLDPDSDDIPTSITPLYTSPQPLQPITADDVTDELHWLLWRDSLLMHTGQQGKEFVAKIVNAWIKHRGDK